LIVTGCLGGLMGVLIELIGFRHLRKKKGSPLLFFVSSITIGMMLEAIIVLAFPVNIFTYPKYFAKSYVRFGGITLIINDMMMLAIAAVMLTIIMILLNKTRFGISVRALSMDSTTASLMGINVAFAIAATFFLAYLTAGMAGMFMGITQTITPTINRVMSKVIVASVLGGLGSVSGAVIGSFIVAILEVILIKIPFIGSSLTPVVLFFLNVGFLILRPQGISGKFAQDKV
jgi:branched-chain amino acid transport system permease protein